MTLLLTGTRARLASKRIASALFVVIIAIGLAILGQAVLLVLWILAATITGYFYMKRLVITPKVLYAITDTRVIEVTLDGVRTLAKHDEIEKITDSYLKTKVVSFSNGLDPIRLNEDSIIGEPSSSWAMMLFREKEQSEGDCLL